LAGAVIMILVIMLVGMNGDGEDGMRKVAAPSLFCLMTQVQEAILPTQVPTTGNHHNLPLCK
jgi:hypothetical protein